MVLLASLYVSGTYNRSAGEYMMELSTLNQHRENAVNRPVFLHPPAKINLSLVVFGPRSDGYHDLHTIMATTSLHDDLSLQVADSSDIELQCTGLPVPTGEKNLVVRTARVLAEHAGIAPALKIRLHKRIPPGAGLGGGSSDAAACLMGLNHLWNLRLSKPQLGTLAASLGSDVPFFLHSPVALCTGRGEITQPLPHRCRRSLLLIMPSIPVPTPLVCKHYQPNEKKNTEAMRCVRYFLRKGDLNGLIIQGVNTLVSTCYELFEPLKQLQEKIESLGIGPLCLSGSGSCLFATGAGAEQTEQWARILFENNITNVRIVTFLQNPTESLLEEHHADI